MSLPAPVLLAERVDDVLLLTMNRLEKHNALNAELHHLIGAAVDAAPASGVRVIVITGAGNRAFCAGGDMVEMSGLEHTSANLPPAGERLDGTQVIARTPLPVIAAINGYCYGGGVRLAIECDIRLASTTSTYRFPGAEYGLVVGAATLPRLVGAAIAKEWILTARRVEAEEALRHGLINSLHAPADLLANAMTMAKTIAANSVEAVRISKQVIDLATLDSGARDLEAEANKTLRGSNEQVARFKAATRRVTGRDA